MGYTALPVPTLRGFVDVYTSSNNVSGSTNISGVSGSTSERGIFSVSLPATINTTATTSISIPSVVIANNVWSVSTGSTRQTTVVTTYNAGSASLFAYTLQYTNSTSSQRQDVLKYSYQLASSTTTASAATTTTYPATSSAVTTTMNSEALTTSSTTSQITLTQSTTVSQSESYQYASQGQPVIANVYDTEHSASGSIALIKETIAYDQWNKQIIPFEEPQTFASGLATVPVSTYQYFTQQSVYTAGTSSEGTKTITVDVILVPEGESYDIGDDDFNTDTTMAYTPETFTLYDFGKIPNESFYTEADDYVRRVTTTKTLTVYEATALTFHYGNTRSFVDWKSVSVSGYVSGKQFVSFDSQFPYHQSLFCTTSRSWESFVKLQTYPVEMTNTDMTTNGWKGTSTYQPINSYELNPGNFGDIAPVVETIQKKVGVKAKLDGSLFGALTCGFSETVTLEDPEKNYICADRNMARTGEATDQQAVTRYNATTRTIMFATFGEAFITPSNVIAPYQFSNSSFTVDFDSVTATRSTMVDNQTQETTTSYILGGEGSGRIKTIGTKSVCGGVPAPDETFIRKLDSGAYAVLANGTYATFTTQGGVTTLAYPQTLATSAIFPLPYFQPIPERVTLAESVAQFYPVVCPRPLTVGEFAVP